MGLVTGITKTVKLSDGEAVIRKLNHKKLKEASKRQQMEGIGWMREVGPELMKALRSEDAAGVDRIQRTTEAAVTSYDRDSLLQMGVISWSYDPPITDSNRVEILNDLDEPTAILLSEAVFRFSRPESEQEAGEDQPGSMST
tara:strand:+ start:2933 stop:3358 length:426 start_codon:yes stop_codon:yes gene_type:complete